ncbi:MAG: imidazoleglycerol-phosphate dehydratase HisB [Kiritimatiellae bacterium]|nr:imidazoleglycerol-phosphate dehydratase HisB [Kiritimatiellia bacterium]
MKKRTAEIRRETRETKISIKLNLDGEGTAQINSGMPFLDHMLTLLARHSLCDISLKAQGDLAVDFHHTVEDIGLCLGAALNKALGTRRGIRRYGFAYAPMDEALSRAAVDMGGRPFLVYRVASKRRKILEFDLGLIAEFMQAFCVQGKLNLHLDQLYGHEPHHAYESMFKALALALRAAVARDSKEKNIPSSKGRL